MHLLDQEFTCFPYYGVAKMTKHICRKGYLVNPKRIRRLLRKMGLMAIYPKKGLSLPEASHKKFPYLLKDLSISRPNQVWATDITYIRLEGAFSIWWWLWTGFPDMCCRGIYPTPWNWAFVWIV